MCLVFVPASKPRSDGKPKATWALCDLSEEIPVFVFFIIIIFLKPRLLFHGISNCAANVYMVS